MKKGRRRKETINKKKIRKEKRIRRIYREGRQERIELIEGKRKQSRKERYTRKEG